MKEVPDAPGLRRGNLPASAVESVNGQIPLYGLRKIESSFSSPGKTDFSQFFS